MVWWWQHLVAGRGELEEVGGLVLGGHPHQHHHLRVQLLAGLRQLEQVDHPLGHLGRKVWAPSHSLSLT